MQEYSSAAHVLEPLLARPETSHRTRFLFYYSTYLSKEKQRAEKRTQPAGLAAYASRNAELTVIEQGVLELGDNVDGFLLYVLGLAYLDMQDKASARRVLSTSLQRYPCNWSAWAALLSACPDFDSAAELQLPDHFTTAFFKAALCAEMQRSSEALEALSTLAEAFPSSDALLHSAALAHNYLHNYEEAQQLFQDLLQKDPCRIKVSMSPPECSQGRFRNFPRCWYAPVAIASAALSLTLSLTRFLLF